MAEGAAQRSLGRVERVFSFVAWLWRSDKVRDHSRDKNFSRTFAVRGMTMACVARGALDAQVSV